MVAPGDVCVNDYRVTIVESGRKRISNGLRVVGSERVMKDVKQLFPRLDVNLCKYVYYLTLSSADNQYKTDAIQVNVNYASKLSLVVVFVVISFY